MLLSIASASALADQVMQAPVLIQCAQAAAEPRWKWWLTLSAEILGPLLSTVGSIYVAWRVFRWQGEKDHKAWIRDQRKAEWSAILGRLTAVDIKMPHVFSNVDWPKLTAGSLEELRNVLPIMRNVIFIAEELAKNELIAGYIDFVSEAAIKIKSIEDINTFYFQSSGLTNPDELAALNNVKIRKMKEREDVYGELYDEFHKQAEIIQKAARTALNLPDGSME